MIFLFKITNINTNTKIQTQTLKITNTNSYTNTNTEITKKKRTYHRETRIATNLKKWWRTNQNH